MRRGDKVLRGAGCCDVGRGSRVTSRLGLWEWKGRALCAGLVWTDERAWVGLAG